jgi:2-polyprenyl-3-methyl-5-hydroxy-6-metoxy-1,4-benzoquinol methylase
MPNTTTNSGLHEFVGEQVLAKYVQKGMRTVDLGSGPGAMAARLKAMGCDVIAVDRDSNGFGAEIPHFSIDFNHNDFASSIGKHAFSLVTAIEVIEHVENPIGFLRNVRGLLAPDGVAVLTTPNVDSLPARLKFCLKGKIRTMDSNSEPTHISPIFLDLFRRQFLPLVGLRLRTHLVFPSDGFQLTRKEFALPLRVMASFLSGEALLGDNHVFVLEANP